MDEASWGAAAASLTGSSGGLASTAVVDDWDRLSLKSAMEELLLLESSGLLWSSLVLLGASRTMSSSCFMSSISRRASPLVSRAEASSSRSKPSSVANCVVDFLLPPRTWVQVVERGTISLAILLSKYEHRRE